MTRGARSYWTDAPSAPVERLGRFWYHSTPIRPSDMPPPFCSRLHGQRGLGYVTGNGRHHLCYQSRNAERIP